MENDIRRRAADLLLKLGFNPGQKRFPVVIDALEALAKSPWRINRLNYDLFQEIGEKRGMKTATVESSIRRAIETACMNSHVQDMTRILIQAPTLSSCVYTTKQFLALATAALERET